MSTTTTTNSKNGQPRKTLASQLDRLDGILDALSEGLNQAVAFTVEEAVKQAVQVAIVEVLTNPDLVARLHSAPVPTTSASPSAAAESGWWAKLKGMAKSAWGKTCQLAGKVWAGTVTMAQGFFGHVHSLATTVTQMVTTTARTTCLWAMVLASLAKQFRTPLLVALGVGAGSAVAACFAGPYFAPVVGWLGGFVTTLAVQAGVAFRRLTTGANEA